MIDIDIDIDMDMAIDIDIESAPDVSPALPDDPAWVAAEFAAILNASGFGDRVIAVTVGPRSTQLRESPGRRSAEPATAAIDIDSSRGARVRSPPGFLETGATRFR